MYLLIGRLMLSISNDQLDTFARSNRAIFASQLTQFLWESLPDRAIALGQERFSTVVETTVARAFACGLQSGRAIARITTVTLLVNVDLFDRPEVKALFAFSGLDADLKADLLCEQMASKLHTFAAQQGG